MGSRLLQTTDWAYTGQRPAAEYVAELTALPVAWWQQWFAKHDDALTWHVHKGLLQHAADSVDDDPARALEAADYVLAHIGEVAIAPGLDDWNRMREVLRAEAWIERGNALHEQCEVVPALEAFERAEEIYTALSEPLDLERARRDRALVLHTLLRPEEALALIDRGLELFRTKQDRPELMRSLLCRGTVLVDTGEEARPALEEALALARELRDPRAEGRILMRLAHDAILDGDGAAAVRFLAEASALFVQHDMNSDLLRVRWAWADLLGSSRERAAACREVLAVIEAFSAAGLHRDAAMATYNYLRIAERSDAVLQMANDLLHFLVRRRATAMAMEVYSLWRPYLPLQR